MHPADLTFLSRRDRTSTAGRRYAAVLVLVTALGFALRLASAQGSLWLDEAWSAVMARDAGTPIAVFLGINHDNNHHLNSVWMQFVGFGAPPPLVRALSIVSGTAAILVAARIGALRDRVTALLSAFAIAVAPVMVTMGSEARGYAPMTLALLCAIYLVQRSLDRDDPDGDALGIAIAFTLGLLSQLTMAFGICAVLGWIIASHLRRGTAPSAAIFATLRLSGPGLLASAGVAALTFGAARYSGTGLRFGDLAPYDATLVLQALAELVGYTVGYTVGWPVESAWIILSVVALVAIAPHVGAIRGDLYRIAILGFPLAIVAMRIGNSGHPRYYLLAGIALLLLSAEVLARRIAAGGWRRALAIVALIAFAGGSTAEDLALIRNQRADPAVAIRALAQRAPHGTRLMIDHPTIEAMVQVAAASQHYSLETTLAPCPAEPFLLLDRVGRQRFPPVTRRCGRLYWPIAQRLVRGMSGTHWTLYARQP